MLNSLYKLFEHKRVLEVCVHMARIFFFLIPILKSSFSNQAVLRFLSELRSSVHFHDSWLTRPSYLSPALNERSSDCHCVDSVVGEDKISQIKRFKCLVAGCNNKYRSRHLLPTSEPPKRQRINVTFALKGMRSVLCITSKVSIRYVSRYSGHDMIRITIRDCTEFHHRII